MSGRRRQGISPTLFPFLAVLICMLGTLILLLAVVTQDAAKAQAQAQTAELPAAGPTADEEALAQAAADLQRHLREAQWHREQTVKMRDEQTAELERRRDELAHLEDHLRRLSDELKLLNTEVEKTLSDDDDAATAQATLDTLLTQIEDEKQAIGQLEQSLQTRTPRIVIVPHKGPNGTDRRPIYIQCRAAGVYLQPGGEHITVAELEGPSGRSNPLDAALRVIRHHAMQTYGDTVAPYPLLVVSPDGIETYAIARSAMKDWDDQFGYELVPAEVELAFPAADPALNEKVALAIRQAAAQQQMLAAGSRGGYGRGHSAGGYRGGQRGGEGHLTTGPGGAGAGGEGAGGAGADGPTVLAAAANTAAGAGGAALADGRGSRPASELPVLSAAEMARGAHPSTTRSPFTSSSSGTTETPLGGQPGELDSSGAKGDSATGNAAAGDAAAGNQAATIGQFTAARDAAAQAAAAGGPGGPSGAPPLAGAESMGDSQSPDRQASGGVAAQVSMHTTPPVTRVGKDWGLPSSLMSSRGTEMLRMIRVECYADRFVLLPERGVGTNTTFSFADGDIDRATLELATVVRDRAAGWGAAMQGARWQPVLDVAVVRGGEASYQELLRLMAGSGVVIQARGTR